MSEVQAAYERVAQAPCLGSLCHRYITAEDKALPNPSIDCRGSTYRFHQLWEECFPCQGTGCEFRLDVRVRHNHLDCRHCSGSGWVLRPREDAPDPMDLAADQGLAVTVGKESRGPLWIAFISGYAGKALIRADATWLALDAAREGKDDPLLEVP